MRYLNKIIFINSSDKSLRYAQVHLDGNVHFIGTQGVGKSTLLRAILFFYNADKQKLGIPREKRSFDDYYFPFQNSYIIYEVKTDTGLFCVLAFKSQGRVAFRFFDSEYDKKIFVDNEGKVYESWDKIRDNLGKNISYTKVIHSYEEYRNILYGNNRGLSAEFRKYALFESRQYQNIPRTITNVFLNAKLDAEFVKETIIKSLHEEEITIDLETYKSHLKDFETELGDIQKWTEKNRSGEYILEKQADQVTQWYNALKYLEKRKIDLASQLGWALRHLQEEQPIIEKSLSIEEIKKRKVEEKLKELDSHIEEKKGKIQKEIGECTSKIKEITSKRKEYEEWKIDEIIERTSKKHLLELDRRTLSNEKAILTTAFSEIENRYQVLIQNELNRFKEFENSKHTEKNLLEAHFLHFKEKLTIQYETILDQIKIQHKAELETALSFVKEKEQAITEQKIKRAEVQHKKFYELEIEGCKHQVSTLTSSISNAENTIRQANEMKRTVEKQWLTEEKSIKEDTTRAIEKQADKLSTLKKQMDAVMLIIENSKDSLYSWLNEQMPHWELSIGKVIDLEHVLYKPGLHPQIVSNDNSSFYGITLDLQEIDREVKTLADYEQEKTELHHQTMEVQKTISGLNTQMDKELDNIKVKYHKKIKELKEVIQRNDYTKTISASKLDEMNVKWIEWQNKAKKDKQEELINIEHKINCLSEEKVMAEAHVTKTENSIEAMIQKKKKEKEVKIKVEQQNVTNKLSKIELDIETEKVVSEKKQVEIKKLQKSELDTKGADTQRIEEIDGLLSKIDQELLYIDTNRDRVAEYNKDKRDLFDHEAQFKNQKTLLENQLETEKQKHEQQKNRYIQEVGLYRAQIEALKRTLAQIEEDNTNYQSFTHSELFQSIESVVSCFSENDKTDLRVSEVITEMNKNHYLSKDHYTDLQECINKFAGHFQENNLFKFKTKFINRTDYFAFADNLKEFIDENKITEFKKRVEERFAHIIRQIGSETNDFISKEGEISQVVKEINNDFVARNFVGAIKSMELRTQKSANPIFLLLVEIKNFNDENSFDLGAPGLFSSSDLSIKNEKAISLLKLLIKEITSSREKEILLSDSFELQFKIVENDNDTGWVEKLTNVGSEGTDTLIKAMINIMLLNVFKDRVTRKKRGDFSLHCMMDEIGKLHPNNVKGILKFANDRNILLINSSPTSYNAADYRYTYLLSKDNKNITNIKRIVSKK